MRKKNKKTLPKIGTKAVRSQFEFDVYKVLKNALPRGATLDYETEKITYIIEAQYIPDFVITLKNGTKFYIEAKGLGRAFDHHARQKMQLIKEQHPDKDVRIIFMRDGPIRKNAKMQASDWGDKHNYRYVVGLENIKEFINER